METRILKRTAVAVAVFGCVGAAVADTTVTVDASDNIYYTGAVPLDKLNNKLDANGNGSAEGVYTGGRMALDHYPENTPKRCKQILDPDQYDDATGELTGVEPSNDTSRKCYGTVPIVVDLSGFTGASLRFRIPTSETVDGVPAYGDLDITYDGNNGQPSRSVVGLFVSDNYDTNGNGVIDTDAASNEMPYWDVTGALNGSYNGLNDLDAYANAVPNNSGGDLDKEDPNGVTVAGGDGYLDDSAIVQGWRVNFPGFVQISSETNGTEFALVGVDNADGYYVRTVEKPTSATHLILGYNAETGFYDKTGTFTVEIQDVSAATTEDLNWNEDSGDSGSTSGGGGGGGSLSWLLGLGLMMPAVLRRRLRK